MKTFVHIMLFILLIMASSCGKRTEFSLKGQLEGMESDTLYALVEEPYSRIDTIIAHRGKFKYSFVPDTLTIFRLLFDNKLSIPLYADKGDRIITTGTIDSLHVDGKGENALLQEMLKRLRQVGEQGGDQQAEALKLIKAHPDSYASLYLIENYFVKRGLASAGNLSSILDSLGGNLRDTRYLTRIQLSAQKSSSIDPKRYVYNISSRNRMNEHISWMHYKDRYMYLLFWASWNPKSVAMQDTLRGVLHKLKDAPFSAMSIALDIDRKQWLNTAPPDTTQWVQVCDFTGWNNDIVVQQNIDKLPASLLIGPDRTLIATDLYADELVRIVKEAYRHDKEKEKAQTKLR